MPETEDHDNIIRLLEMTKEILRRLDVQDAAISIMRKDFDGALMTQSARLTVIENFRWYALGGIMVASFFFSLLATYLKAIFIK